MPIVILLAALLTIGGLIFLYSKRKHETGITKSKNKIFMVALISLIVMSLVSIPVFGHADERTSEPQVTEVGALELTQQIIGWANFENNKVEITQQLELKNIASDKIISIDSVTAALEEGYKDIDIKNWIIENDKTILFKGTGGDSYPTDVIIPIGKTLTFTVTTDMTAQQARDLNGKVPFNISYSFLEEPGSMVYFDLNGGYIESGEETLVDWDLIDGIYQKSYKNGTPITDIVAEWDDVVLKSDIDLDFVKWEQDNTDITLQRSTTFTAEYQTAYTVTIDLGEGHFDGEQPEGWTKQDNKTFTKIFINGTSIAAITNEWKDADIKADDDHKIWEKKWNPSSGIISSATTITAQYTQCYDVTVKFGDGKYTGETPSGWTKDADSYTYTKDFNEGTNIADIITVFDISKVEAPEDLSVVGFDKISGTITDATTITMQYGSYQYMVTIYDIKDGQVTFGGTVGADSSCLEVDGHASHSAGKHCIHEDSWEEIIHNINEGHADYYSECMQEGCTKAVPITLNSTIGTMPVGTSIQCSTLYSNINSDYRRWNYSYTGDSANDPASQWETSRLRATLNGYNNTWGGAFTPHTKYAGSNNLTKDNCLLSCFPTVLQNNIKVRTYNVPSRWSNSSPYTIGTSVTVKDKLWLPNANEIWSSTRSHYDESVYGYSQFGRQVAMGIGSSDSFRTNNKYFNENKAARSSWLRCPTRFYFANAGSANDYGFININLVDYDYFGLAPCFII